MGKGIQNGSKNIFLAAVLLLVLGGPSAYFAQTPPAPAPKAAGEGAAEPGNAPVLPQEGPQTQEAPKAPEGVPVIIDGREVWRVREPLGPFSVEMRAKTLERRLETLGNDPSYDENAFELKETASGSEVFYRGALIGMITEEDARAEVFPGRNSPNAPSGS